MAKQIQGEDGWIYYRLEAKGEKKLYLGCGDWDDGPGGDVKQICLCYDDHVIYSLQTTYERQGTAMISPRHGGGEGNFEIITFDGPLTWVSGHYGRMPYDLDSLVLSLDDDDDNEYFRVITSLKFGTNRRTYGPFGSESGPPFSFKCSTGIHGFHGVSTNYLQAIGVYVRSMATDLLVRQSPPPPLREITTGATAAGLLKGESNPHEEAFINSGKSICEN